MAEQSITCPSCNKKLPLTRALRADIEASVRTQYEERERELKDSYERLRDADVQRVWKEAAALAEKQAGEELASLREQLAEQKKRLDEAQRAELAVRRRERDLERRQQEVEITVARQIDEERGRLLADAQERWLEQHRLKDAERERQLADMRRQIEDLKRRAEQGSQQLQGEAGEEQLEQVLRSAFPQDDITNVVQGVRGADLHHVVVDARGQRCGALLWECKNARNWSDAWIAKLKQDQRALKADVAILVSSVLPKGCSRFALVDGVLVVDFVSASALAAVVRTNLLQLAQARAVAVSTEARLELLHRYLSGLEFRQRVEAIVEAFAAMRQELEQERRAAERQWSRRARQIEAVTFNIAGMYGDLQGLVPALPPIAMLELPAEAEAVNDARTLPF